MPDKAKPANAVDDPFGGFNASRLAGFEGICQLHTGNVDPSWHRWQTEPGEETMTSMSVTASTPSFTVHDLEGMPDDGCRYELIDGKLLVSPAPGLRHQTFGLRLYRVLDDACPDELYVLAAPFAVRTDLSNQGAARRPGGLVRRADRQEPARRTRAGVEVLSPSGWLIDLNLEPAAYQRMGTPWILDPEVPDLLVLELDVNGEYEEAARVVGDEIFEARRPFEVGSCRPSCSDASVPVERPMPSWWVANCPVQACTDVSTPTSRPSQECFSVPADLYSNRVAHRELDVTKGTQTGRRRAHGWSTLSQRPRRLGPLPVRPCGGHRRAARRLVHPGEIRGPRGKAR